MVESVKRTCGRTLTGTGRYFQASQGILRGTFEDASVAESENNHVFFLQRKTIFFQLYHSVYGQMIMNRIGLICMMSDETFMKNNS